MALKSTICGIAVSISAVLHLVEATNQVNFSFFLYFNFKHKMFLRTFNHHLTF